ncbi:type II secretion system protein N [Caulobacter endophyticus]|uniref:type II secretion system protein N n=1 Tax=Caulobacter endophyticus TaxID=2172652 RepID=UPI00240F2C4D|nr:type II secretion system protein N [Caulobacter endophyticus]MDG2531386.1 type II secretion system protein N [Caulobacter endophyticus]
MVLLILAAQIARLVWIVAAPPPPLAVKAAPVHRTVDPKILASFDAFGSAGASSRVGGAAGVEGFRLFGVRQTDDGGSAIIAGPDGVQKSYAVGEAVADGVTLASVAADHVELSRAGARMTLSFPERP